VEVSKKKVIFEAMKGDGGNGWATVDDIHEEKGTHCAVIPPQAAPPTAPPDTTPQPSKTPFCKIFLCPKLAEILYIIKPVFCIQILICIGSALDCS
jgi:hypothetical protein